MLTGSGFLRASKAPFREILRGSMLFGGLGDEEIDSVLAEARVAKYSADAQIIAKGDSGQSMMAVLKGRVSIRLSSAHGRQVVLSVLRSGDLFGEIALIDGKERSADVIALTRCEILIIPRRSLWRLLETRHDLCVDLMLLLCDRLRHTNQQVEDLAFLDLPSRMAKVLLQQLEIEEGEHDKFVVRISQRTLGELARGSRESVNKCLNIWKDSGIISIDKGTIVIREIAALAKYIP
jgi:CRP-like cAMP-binding protein